MDPPRSLSPFLAARRMLRIAGAEQERLLGERAVAAGLITEQQLADALAAQAAEGEPRTLEDILLSRGWIAPDGLAPLEQALVGDDVMRSAAKKLAPLPPEAAAAAADPTRQLAEFVLCERIGQGGAGEVLKAWDRNLGRWVAIKRPPTSLDSSAARERFQREAFAAARLQHPNIVPVFRVGEADGRPYLVMPFIEGRTLAHHEGRSVSAALALMHTAALAVHHAHQQGLVHRDIKPGNLIVNPERRLFILDFGLVYLLADPSSGIAPITQAGDVMGTPAYMSPEQARGAAAGRDPATDIYGLGATLYHLVTGRAPFEGESFAEIAAKVVRDEPPPARRLRPELSRDIQNVIEKAMDKDPRRRYASAAAFAEDLRRLLAHEAVAARSLSLPGRVARNVRRHKLASAGALLVLLAGALAGVALLGVRRERRAAVEAIRETARLSLETALRLRRAGDYAGMLAAMPRLTSAYQRAIKRAPDLAEVDYLMGRMHRALMQDREALPYQEQALRKDPNYAPAIYERALLLSKLYGQGFNRAYKAAERIKHVAVTPAVARSAPPPRRDDIEKAKPDLTRMREIITADFRRLQSLRADALDALAASGIQAFHEERHADARRLLAEVVARDPLRDEAWEHLGLAAAAAHAPDEAERAYTQGLSHDRGYLPYFLRRCRARNELGNPAGALEDATQVLAARPDDIDAILCRGVARAFLGHEQSQRGRDPTTELAAALEDCSRARRRAPENIDAWIYSGIAQRLAGFHRMTYGGDPSGELAAADEMFARAIAIDEQHPSPWRGRGRSRAFRAYHRMSGPGGVDPMSDFAAAEADLTEAIRRDPSGSVAWFWRGELFAYRGRYRMEHGEDPMPDLARADDDLGESLRHRETDGAHAARGLMLTWRGLASRRHGRDPLPDFAAAEEELTRALALRGSVADYWVWRATLRSERAALRGRARDAVAADRAGADEDRRRALALNPKHPALSRLRGK